MASYQKLDPSENPPYRPIIATMLHYQLVRMRIIIKEAEEKIMIFL